MNKLEITEFGTIQSDDDFEMTLEKFIKKLERNIKKRNYSVLYNAKDNSFYIVFKGKEYVIELNGIYNDFMSRLMRLSNMQPKIYQNCVEIVLDKERREKIIEDAEKGYFPNDEARAIYLEFLKEQRKYLLDDYLFMNFAVDEGASLREGKVTYAFASIMFAVIGSTLGGIIFKKTGLFYPVIVGGLMGLSVPTLFEHCVISFIINKRKVIKNKIKGLELSLNKSSLNYKQSRTYSKSALGEVKKYPFEFKETIYKEISDLLDKIDGIINQSEKIKLKGEAKTILAKYNKGLKEAQKGEMGSGDIVVLRNRIRREILVVDTKVDDIFAREITEVEMKIENDILQKRLEEPIVIDSEVIDCTLREREENKVPVRVRKKELSRAKVTY